MHRIASAKRAGVRGSGGLRPPQEEEGMGPDQGGRGRVKSSAC